jgi:hypothetical protein
VLRSSTKIDEVLSEGVEACRCGLAELAEIVAKSADVAVGGSREYRSGRAATRDSRSPGSMNKSVAVPADSVLSADGGVRHQQALAVAWRVGRRAGSDCAAMCPSA